MTDLWTMLWKEWKDLIFRDRRGGLLRHLLFIGILGIVLPWLVGLQWLELPAGAMLVVLYIPFLFIISFVGDAIAGERERHTLETLLASRMPDRVILLGKVIATVGYAWGMAVAGLLLGVVWANLLNGNGGWMFYHPFDLLLEWLALILVVILLAASTGVLISLRVATVRQAQQTLQIGTLVLVIAALLVLRALPENFIASLSYSQIMLIAIAVIATLDAILLGLALESFQRSRLILS
ncbi:MAG: ABC transporter permease [Chloroflexi bacterium]|nr:ABC transporter permease [Chloroflexota bacterium]